MDNKEATLSGIDVPGIEKEIRALWQQKSEATEGQAVTRACVLNLVVFASGPDAQGDVSKTLAEVTTVHPSRSLVLLPRPTASDGITAMVTTQCHNAGSGRQQICSEEVLIRADGDRVNQLPSAVRPLLVADLPVALWWRSAPDFSGDLFREMVEIAGRVIVDSGRFPNPGAGLAKLAELSAKMEGTAFSDLAWTRLNGWRRQIASFYNVPENRPHLDQLKRVEIDCGRGNQNGLPVEALLVSAWLSSRLGWAPQSCLTWKTDESCAVTLDCGEGSVEIVINLHGGAAGLSRVRLSSADALFEVALNQDRTHLETRASLAGKKRSEKVVLYHQRNEAFVLARELEIQGHDHVYEQAMAAVGALAG